MEIARIVTIFRILHSRIFQFFSFLVVLYSLYAVYNFSNALDFIKYKKGLSGNGMMIFTDDNKQIKNETLLSVSKLKTTEFVKGKTEQAIDVVIIFSDVVYYSHLQKKFATTVASLLRFSSIPINLFVLGDLASYRIAQNILKEATDSHKYRVSFI